MPPSGTVTLLFLPSKTPANNYRKSKRQLEIEDQEARAHAASISHHRAGRCGKPKGQIRTIDHGSTCDRRPLPLVEEDFALREAQTQSEWTSQGLAWIKTGPLDPFFYLPTDLNMKDRNLLFFCKCHLLPPPLVTALITAWIQISTRLHVLSMVLRRIPSTVRFANAQSPVLQNHLYSCNGSSLWPR